MEKESQQSASELLDPINPAIDKLLDLSNNERLAAEFERAAIRTAARAELAEAMGPDKMSNEGLFPKIIRKYFSDELREAVHTLRDIDLIQEKPSPPIRMILTDAGVYGSLTAALIVGTDRDPFDLACAAVPAGMGIFQISDSIRKYIRELRKYNDVSEKLNSYLEMDVHPAVQELYDEIFDLWKTEFERDPSRPQIISAEECKEISGHMGIVRARANEVNRLVRIDSTGRVIKAVDEIDYGFG